MRKIICATSIFFLHLSLLGCDSDIFDVMNSRKNIVIQYFALYKLLTNPTNPEPGSCNSISQYGITWTFDKEYQYGQFANGDYWVIGPVKIVKITPESKAILGTTTISGFTPGSGPNASIRIMNGSVINPAPGNGQAYDNEMYRWVPSASF